MIPCINYTRVESAHWSLKKVLGSSVGDLCSCWDEIHVIILQHNEIKASFERSLNLMSDSYKALIYRRLVGNISRCALELLIPELERVKKIGFDTSRCGCILIQTYGLPCACELARYDPEMIPLQEIHVMWTIPLHWHHESSAITHACDPKQLLLVSRSGMFERADKTKRGVNWFLRNKINILNVSKIYQLDQQIISVNIIIDEIKR